IPVREQPRLFQPFSRLEQTAGSEGTGLGLAMVAALARLMGGQVEVRSDGATGSRFVVELALRPVQAPAYTREGGKVAGTVQALQGQRIVVAEYNRLVSELFVSALTDCGAVCRVAADGETAVHTVLAEPLHALVLDL